MKNTFIFFNFFLFLFLICTKGDASGSASYDMRMYGHTSGPATDQVIATLLVTGIATTANPSSLTSFTPNRPTYLTNLLNWSGSIYQYLRGNNFQDSFTAGVQGAAFNNIPFAGPNSYQANASLGVMSQFDLNGANNHAYHLHINVRFFSVFLFFCFFFFFWCHFFLFFWEAMSEEYGWQKNKFFVFCLCVVYCVGCVFV